MKDQSNQHNHHALTFAGLLITLGIIYGDIGTSPLYVMKSIVGEKLVNKEVIYGAVSLVFWTLTIQTTFKYVTLVLRADNNGEGGIFSLYTLAFVSGHDRRLCGVVGRHDHAANFRFGGH
jgi:KUP system potassium uptake protein